MKDKNHKIIKIDGNELKVAINLLQKCRTDGINDKDIDKVLLYILDSPKSSSNENSK